ncbi:uncharacterized protein LOC135484064 isoform X2 [Lineus longissimus]|uniref:uncharacterized protein LOC135484064 isoform X2 n=1 Tax=Lineus longissimus TaxID=88925 RepID=UPI00315C73F4
MSTPQNNNGPGQQWPGDSKADTKLAMERKEKTNKANDRNKRPLSSSSGSSSSSSLPRHTSKKSAAAMSVSDPGPWSSLVGESPKKEVLPEPTQMDTVSDDESQADTEPPPDMEPLLEESDQSEYASRLEQSDSSQCITDKVVNEILITERTYVKDLEEIIEGYLDYIIHNPELPLTSKQVSELFGNIEDIHSFNSTLLEKLENCDMSPALIAQCFVDHNEGFSIYTNYCTNYPSCMSTLTTCMGEKEIADAFRERQRALQHALPLGSYLLKPVQRILKYHLLLQSMLNNSDENSPDYATIKDAFDSMTGMAQHINEMKRRHEDAVRIQEIQSILYQWQGEDLTTYGELLLEDSFKMHGAKGHRHLFLFEKAMLITKRKEDGTQSLICKDCIKCSNLMLIESIPKEPLSFHVIPFDNPRLQYTMQAKDLDHKRKWCHEIKRLILENYSAVIPEKAKALVMMLGNEKEKESTREHADTKRHAAPEYLEKRRGARRKSGTFIPDFVLKSQRGKKGQRKPGSEFFLPSPKNDEDSTVTLRGRTGKNRERPRSKSIDYGMNLLHFRDRGEKKPEKKSPGKEAAESAEKTNKPTHLDVTPIRGAYGGRARHAKRHASFRFATAVNRVDSNSFGEDYRQKYHGQIKEEMSSSMESLDTDFDSDMDAMETSQRSGSLRTVPSAEGRLQTVSDDEYVTLMDEGQSARSQLGTECDSEDDYMTLRYSASLQNTAAAAAGGHRDRSGDYVEIDFSKYLMDRWNGAMGRSGDKDDKNGNKSDDGAASDSSGKGVYDNVTFGDAYRRHMAGVAASVKKTSKTSDRSESPIWNLNNSSQESLPGSSKQGKAHKSRTLSFTDDFNRKPSVNRSHSFSGMHSVNTETPVRLTSTPRLSLSSLFQSKTKISPRREKDFRPPLSPQKSYSEGLRSLRTTISELYHTLPNLRSKLHSQSEDELASNRNRDFRQSCSAECSPDHRPQPFFISPPLNWETDSPMTSTDDVRPSPDIWNDLEEYIANTSDGPLLPKFPIPEVALEEGEELFPPPDLASDATSLTGSGRSLMGTLKTKVTKVKSKISNFRSSRLGSDSQSGYQVNNDDGSDSDALAERERQSKLVYQLARSYSAKLRREKKEPGFLARQFQSFKENKFDSANGKNGSNKPIELDTYLPRHRPPRPQSNNRDIIIGAASVPSSTMPSKESSPERQLSLAYHDIGQSKCEDLGTMSDPEGGNLDTGEEFIRGLESLVVPKVLESGSDFRKDPPPKSRLRCHVSSGGGGKDAGSSFDSDSGEKPCHHQGLTIKDTIKMLEERSQSRGNKPPLPRVVVNRREKGHMIKERLQKLESNCSPESHRRRNFYERYYHTKYESDSESIPRKSKSSDKLGERRTRSAERHKDRVLNRTHSDNDTTGGDLSDNQDLDPEVLADNLRGYVQQVLDRFEF